VEKRGSATDAITDSTAISGTTEIVMVYSNVVASIGGETSLEKEDNGREGLVEDAIGAAL